MHIAGSRRISPAAMAGQQASRRYPDCPRIARKDALRVAKLGAAALGLKAAKLALIDQLFAFSKAGDWTGSHRPVVWPSNATLARRLALSISTMKHHLRGLVEAGLVAYADGPTFQRSGRRDAAGNIVEGNGIDLSPIAVRFVELSELVAVAEEAARERQALSYRRTVLRREIEAVLSDAARLDLAGSWQDIQARLDRIREVRAIDGAVLANQVEQLEGLRTEAEEAYEVAFDSRNLDTALSKFRPIQTTADLPISESSIEWRDPDGSHHNKEAASGGERAFERKPAETKMDVQAQDPAGSSALQDDIVHISIGLVREACPLAGEFIPEAFLSWTALRVNADALCRTAGINPQVLAEARLHLGSDLAAVAVALTVQRSSAGEVHKPGAYLRTLVKRGREGELHLSRSLFALQKQFAGLSGARH